MKSMPSDQTYRPVSFWLDTVPGSLAPGEVLPGDLAVDVAIAGAGLTGLWTAYYLATAQPGLRVAVCEAEIAGFGASGRNGGWCSALFPASLGKLTRMAGRDAAVAMYRAMQATVDEVGRVAAAENIDCHWAKGGTVQLARSAVQLERAKAEVAEMRDYGFGEEDLTLLTENEARGRLGATGVLGGTYTPHCAAIHPARLVRGLAQVVRERGVKLFERTPVTEIAPGKLVTTRGTVTADYVIRATEGYTPALPGLHRAVIPGVLADDRDRAAAGRGVGGRGPGRPAHLQRRPSPADLRPAHRRRAVRLRRPGRALPSGLGRAAVVRPGARGVRGAAADAGRTVPRPRGRRRSRMPGAGRWASPGTGAPPRAWTAPPGSAGPAGTSATGWPPPTWPGAPWRT